VRDGARCRPAALRTPTGLRKGFLVARMQSGRCLRANVHPGLHPGYEMRSEPCVTPLPKRLAFMPEVVIQISSAVCVGPFDRLRMHGPLLCPPYKAVAIPQIGEEPRKRGSERRSPFIFLPEHGVRIERRPLP